MEPALKLIESLETEETKRGSAEIHSNSLTILESAQSLIVIHDDDALVRAENLLKLAAKGEKAATDFMKPQKQKADEMKQILLDKEKELKAPYQRVRQLLDPAVIAYRTDQQRKRQEAERIAREAARKQAEEEALKKAVELEKEGFTKEANSVLAAPPVVPRALPIAPKPIAKSSGVGIQERWSSEIIDLMTLVKAVAAGKVPLAALEPNMTYLNNQARMLKKDYAIPGSRATSNLGTNIRGK